MYGVKTGVTGTAGPCLCSAVRLDGRDMIIVLLGSKSMDVRWAETMKLAKWTCQRLNLIKKFQMKHNEKPLVRGDATGQIQHNRLLQRITHL